VTTSGTGSRDEGTVRSTGSCTPWLGFSCATRHRAASTTTARRPTAKHRWKPCAASSADSPTSCSKRCSTTPWQQARGQAREDNGETTLTPARPAHIPEPALRTSHFPDLPRPSLRPHSRSRLDTEGCQIRTLEALSRRRAGRADLYAGGLTRLMNRWSRLASVLPDGTTAPLPESAGALVV